MDTTFQAAATELALAIMREPTAHPDARFAAAEFALHLQNLPADLVQAAEWTARAALLNGGPHA